MVSTAEDLRRTKAVIADQDDWTVGWFYRDAAGREIRDDIAGAVERGEVAKVCVRGAHAVALGIAGLSVFERLSRGWETSRLMEEAAKELFTLHPWTSVAMVNDSCGWAAVHQMLDRAIEMAEGR